MQLPDTPSPTIAADDFLLDGDRAWLVFGGPDHDPNKVQGVEGWKWDDRPCDTCEGLGCDMDFCQQCGDEYTDPCDRHADHAHETSDDNCCPDCIDGRHTWNIGCSIRVAVQYDNLENAWIGGERAPQYDHVGSESSRVTFTTFRVAVVPGMVLPIVQLGWHSIVGVYIVRGENEPYRFWQVQNTEFPVECDEITLPSGARPGRFAVQLNVERITA